MNHDDLCYFSAVDLVAAIRARILSPVEVTRAMLERIDRFNPILNAFCTSMADEALAAAHQAEATVLEGKPLGPLHGVPVSIKDILAVKDVRTTSGSKLLEHNLTREDAPAVERLRRAGAILIGRTTTPEFGWKGVTDSRVFGITRNPWNPALTPGGSSGGAAAAVAAGLGPIGLGTDGGGSIRIPASFCGVVGLKASFGRVPNYPATALDSVRHTGPLTRTVADAALVLNALAGPDERDPYSLPPTGEDFLEELERDLQGLRLAYSADLGYAHVDPEVARLCRQTARRLTEAGASVEEIALPWDDPYECWQVFFYGGLSAYLTDSFPDQGDQLDPGLRQIVEAGRSLRAIDYVNALFQRNAFWQKVRLTFASHDLLVTPTLPIPAFPVGQDNAEPPDEQPRPLQWTRFTYPFNLTGQPAVSVPCGWTMSGLPVGLQIVGRRFADATVLRAARALERLQPWAQRRPQASKT